MTVEVRSFYCFRPLSAHEARAARLRSYCQDAGLLGTILLADEGINGTLAGEAKHLDGLLALLGDDPEIGALSYRVSFADQDDGRGRAPFTQLKIRLQDSVLTFPEAAAERTPDYVEPQDWDALLAQEAVQLLDTRNGYETCIGAFKGARILEIENFHEWPQQVRLEANLNPEAPVALYCTAGIRCEKASGWLRTRGFQKIYQLRGGIIEYLAKVPAEAGSWVGDCFVFDQRIAIDRSRMPAAYVLCESCQRPVHQSASCTCEASGR